MLKLLLDEQISPVVAQQLRRRQPEMVVHDVLSWKQGIFIGAPDDSLLEAAYDEYLTLVTFDQSSIPGILKNWAEQGIAHGGVVLIDNRTYRQNDIGGLVKALENLWKLDHGVDWTNRVSFLMKDRV
jgi:hypothetical protein